MPENPRIDELRRRVQKDPASIAFAQLGEEYRRACSYDDAIATCRAGLAVHPGYLSARVTLGRSLIATNDLDAGETELACVLRSAPENLAAIRGLADIHHRRGELAQALGFYRTALGLARHDPELENAVEELSRVLELERTGAAAEVNPAPLPSVAPQQGQALPGLERFLGAIHTYRQRRAV